MVLQLPDYNHPVTESSLWDKEWYNFIQEMLVLVNAGGGGGTDDHTQLINIGIATHPQIDTHINDNSIHFLKNSISHTVLMDIGTNTHNEIDVHIADGTIHFTEGSIDHENIQNIGDNTHPEIDAHIDKQENIIEITKEPTGFTAPEDVVITGNGDRTITLTGTFEAYYQGVLNTTIIPSWTSDPHGTDTGTGYFLLYNGSTIDWVDVSALPDNVYDNLMITIAIYADGAWKYVRETHGFMQWQSHRENHDTIGTYRQAGGDVADYVLTSTTVAERRPSVSQTSVKDEDCITSNPALASEGNYTNFYLDGVSAFDTFDVSATDIVPLSGNQPYWNEFTGGAWQQTLMSNNSYMSVWLMAIPMTSDSGSQELRYIWIQGQSQSSTLLAQQNLTPSDVSLGTINLLFPETVLLSKIILRYIGGNWQFVEVERIEGTRFSQTSSPQGNFLSAVSSDTSLTGDGTAGDPLIVSTDFFNKTTDDTDDITDTATNRFTNDTDINRLANTSGTNTGDITVTDSAEIDFTLTGQDLTADLIAGSIDETKLDTSVNDSLDLADSATQPADLTPYALLAGATFTGDIKFGDGISTVFGDADEASINYTVGDVLEFSANADVARLTNQPSGGTDLAISTTKYANDVASSGGSAGFYKDYINGGVVSNDGGTPDEIINVSAVRTRSSDDTVNIVVAQTDLDITDDADWASGTAPVEEDLFVAMTSNTTPSGEECWATTEIPTANRNPWEAFDKTNTDSLDCWHSAINASMAANPEILLRKMSSSTPIGVIPLTSRNISTAIRYPIDFTLVYTEDDMSSFSNLDTALRGISFTTVKTLTGQSFTQNETKTYTLDSEIPITATAWGIVCTDSSDVYVSIGKMEGLSKGLENRTINTWADYNAGTNILVFDDVTGSNIAGAKRRIDSFITDSDGDIIPFTKKELAGGSVRTEYPSMLLDFTGTGDFTVSVPKGIYTTVFGSVELTETGSDASVYGLKSELTDYYNIAGVFRSDGTARGGGDFEIPTITNEMNTNVQAGINIKELYTNAYKDERNS
jgi:hypothetical protein